MIALNAEPAPLWTLMVSDDGIGFPAAGSNGPQEGLGRRIVDSLALQLDATIDVKSDRGASVAITFRP
jgi:two-component sensor histidine kinase